MRAGELAVAFIFGGLGFASADFLDRYLATYNPSASGAAPTDRFTGGTNGTLANTLNIASPPSMVRLGAGIGITTLFGLGAYVARRSPLGGAALQGATIGAGIKVFQLIWNSWVMPKLLKPADATQATMQASLGARLYPAEVVAQQNLATSPVPYTAPQGLNRAQRMAGQLGGPPQDVGPFAVGQPQPQAQQAAQNGGPPPASGNGQQIPPQQQQPPGGGCGCLGDRLPRYLGFMNTGS